MFTWRNVFVLAALSVILVVSAGCASRQRYAMEEPATIERPAQPLAAEEGFADRVGQVGVVLLVVLTAVGGILLPILLL